MKNFVGHFVEENLVGGDPERSVRGFDSDRLLRWTCRRIEQKLSIPCYDWKIESVSWCFCGFEKQDGLLVLWCALVSKRV